MSRKSRKLVEQRRGNRKEGEEKTRAYKPEGVMESLFERER